MEQTKKCGKCGTEKSVTEFVKNKYQADGYHWECKVCVKAYQTANREKFKEYQKQYQAVYRKEKYDELLEYTKQWQKENRAKTREYARKSMANQSDEKKAARKEYNRLWCKNNPDKVKAMRERALAKKLAQKNDQQ